MRTISTPKPAARAWEAYLPGCGSINSETRVTRFEREAQGWAKDGWQITPLYAAPPSGEAGEVTEDMVRVACGRYMNTINSQPEDQRNGALAMRAALEAVRALPTIKEPTDGK